jgi:hypothetical protein
VVVSFYVALVVYYTVFITHILVLLIHVSVFINIVFRELHPICGSFTKQQCLCRLVCSVLNFKCLV